MTSFIKDSIKIVLIVQIGQSSVEAIDEKSSSDEIHVTSEFETQFDHEIVTSTTTTTTTSSTRAIATRESERNKFVTSEIINL